MARPYLTEPAQRALRHVEELLRDGFSGTIELVCNEGGVKRIDTRTSVNPSRLDGAQHIQMNGAQRTKKGV